MKKFWTLKPQPQLAPITSPQFEEVTVNNLLGVITKIDSLGGEISGGKYVFSREVLPNCSQLPPRHTMVEFNAVLRGRFHNWTVTSMRYLSSENPTDEFVTADVVPKHSVWDFLATLDREEEEEKKVAKQLEEELFAPKKVKLELCRHIGMITHISNGVAQINEGMHEFSMDKCVHQFPLSRGDWVVMEMEKDKTPSAEEEFTFRANRVLRVYPLRLITYRGEISTLSAGSGRYASSQKGLISGKITFYTNALMTSTGGRGPLTFSRGTAVEGIAMESCQGNHSNHRALTMNRLQSTDFVASVGVLSVNQWLTLNEEEPKQYSAPPNTVQFTPLTLNFDEMQLKEEKSLILSITRKAPLSTGLFTLKRVIINNLHNHQFYVQDYADCDLPVQIEVHCHAHLLGRDEQMLHVYGCQDDQHQQLWHCSIPLQVNVLPASPPANVLFREKERPYRRQRPPTAAGLSRNQERQQIVIPGEKIFTVRSRITSYLPQKLPNYPIPQHLKDIIQSKENCNAQITALTETYPELSFNCQDDINHEQYAVKQHYLLYLEELFNHLELSKYNLTGVRLESGGNNYLALCLDGLQEGRPSLLVGDKLSVEYSNQNDPAIHLLPHSYEAFVHEIHQSKVFLKFHSLFHANYSSTSPVNVTFILSSTWYRRIHRSIDWSRELDPCILFPEENRVDFKGSQICSSEFLPKSTTTSAANFTFFQSNLNQEQKDAVFRVLHGYYRPVPYIIFGPPGTGKTITLTECILQVYEKVATSRIIVCTPSNSAADLIAHRLLKVAPFLQEGGILVRLIAYNRSLQDARSKDAIIHDELRKHVLVVDQICDAAMYRIIVCTSTCAGLFYDLNLQIGHFTHVFFDEAGQATEPEALVPLGLVAQSNGQIVLAGDPQQLGPVIQSRVAQQFGFGDSLLHRLLNSDKNKNSVYFRIQKDKKVFNPLFITKLVRNYRSHEAILHSYSTMFYDNDLICSSEPEQQLAVLKAAAAATVLASASGASSSAHTSVESLFPNESFPIVFHGIRGEEMREFNSPSTMNLAEAMMVVEYTMGFIMRCDISGQSIGIVTPYRKQVEKIRLLLHSMLPMESTKIKVGSVEEFQGQERDVILLSTVRSSAASELMVTSSLEGGILMDDGLGFIMCPRRFNVAISRAKKALIVVGNPFVLSRDGNWKCLMKYALDNGGYRGCDISQLFC